MLVEIVAAHVRDLYLCAEGHATSGPVRCLICGSHVANLAKVLDRETKPLHEVSA